MHHKTEMQLIAESQRGNSEAIDELFQRHYPLSVSLARRILPAGDEFADAVQSAYLSAFRNISSFRGDSSFKTWITRIVVNQCLMRLRSSVHHRRCVSLDSSSDSRPATVVDRAPTPEALAQRAELCKTLVNTFARLPRPLREAFTLCVVSGLSIAETAKALGLTVPATKTRIFRARALMRSELKHMHGRRQPLHSTAPVLSNAA